MARLFDFDFFIFQAEIDPAGSFALNDEAVIACLFQGRAEKTAQMRAGKVLRVERGGFSGHKPARGAGSGSCCKRAGHYNKRAVRMKGIALRRNAVPVNFCGNAFPADEALCIIKRVPLRAFPCCQIYLQQLPGPSVECIHGRRFFPANT